jgi:hypothetical protein
LVDIVGGHGFERAHQSTQCFPFRRGGSRTAPTKRD